MKLMIVALAALLMTFVAEAQLGPGGRPSREGGAAGWHAGERGGGWGDHDHDGGFGEHRGGGRWGGGVWYPTYPSYGQCGWDGFYCHDTYVSSGTVECAPKQVEGNVVVTEKTLNALAATSAFSSAKTFKAELAQVAKIKDAGEKAQAYLQLAGINSNDKAAVAAFIGSRDAKGSWVTDLQRNADLTNAQAETVASSLQTALRGNLQ